ncbi:MAG: NADH-quinone oxidoreductase subunit A [Pyrobaculum sp.]|jgi:NADH-quinone oxidoreductase subunit A
MVAVVLFIALFLAALVLLVVVGYLFSPKRPSETKERRFEAGGPPYGPVQRRLLMQYFGYIYLVTVVEAAAGLALVAVLTTDAGRAALAPLAAALVVAIAAVVAVVWRYFKLLADVRRWG